MQNAIGKCPVDDIWAFIEIRACASGLRVYNIACHAYEKPQKMHDTTRKPDRVPEDEITKKGLQGGLIE